MRKLIGLCFLTATLLASSANAQSIFIEKGDPSTMSATLGGQYGGLYGGSLNLGYSYRGVFDVGLDASGTHFTAGDNKNLNALNVMPFMNWHAFRSDVDELPVSISFLVGIEKLLYAGNNVRANGATTSDTYASPSGWGVVLGGSVYRRLEIGTSMLLIPEAVVAYEFMSTRYYSNAMDQNNPSVGDNSVVNGYRQTSKHGVRALGRLNLGFQSGERVWTVTPYGGVQGTYGAVFGLTAGVVL
jgi:hypothetical protein